MANTWEQTKLWHRLCDLDASQSSESLKASLRTWMPEIEAVLRSSATSPSDFTLHDEGHAFRVADNMVEPIPTDVFGLLPPYELGLLLLSAYLHDIGMAPEKRRVTQHHELLLCGDVGTLSAQHIAEFQAWLDVHGRGYTLPLPSQLPIKQRLQLSNELVTHYVRARHNAWGEEWIRSYSEGKTLFSYHGWLDDLTLLCRSHHYDYGKLASSEFDPRLVGTPAAVINLRYLAAVLRVADILDFDPERTPEVILKHRDIAPGSMIYWHKDKQISRVWDGKRLVISARPTSAVIHRAIEETIDTIDTELGLCQRLANDVRFDHCPGLNEPLKHRWDIASSVHASVVPRQDTYEYIDGSFRPNTQKLLQLLSGSELYGTPLAAVRELVQNAFDAVKEEIAMEMLANRNLTEADASRMHRIEIRFESSPDGMWLVCGDTGAGMTKMILRDHFLVSGAGRRPDLLDLERRCSTSGVPLERTGSFGIGVLSYFMLAERVVVRTRRSPFDASAQSTGWVFETEGWAHLASFGATPIYIAELRSGCCYGSTFCTRPRRSGIGISRRT